MDAQALLTPDAVEQYMGVPLAHVPAPAGELPRPTTRATSPACSSRRSPAWASSPSCYWMSERVRRRATMDPYIGRALDHADVDPARSTARSATVNHPADWLPISVICENCGRIGTTIATRLGRQAR